MRSEKLAVWGRGETLCLPAMDETGMKTFSPYRELFNPLIALKAITYHEDKMLAHQPLSMRNDLVQAARGVNAARLPTMTAVCSKIQDR